MSNKTLFAVVFVAAFVVVGVGSFLYFIQ